MPEITIGELARRGVLVYGDGYRTKRSEHGRPGYRILRVADVLDGRVEADGEDYVRGEFAAAIGPKASRAGDVLLTTKGSVGRVAIYPYDAEQVVYSPQLCYFRVKDPSVLEPRFLAYWFKSASFLRQAAHRANSTDMAAYINLRDISSLTLSLPEIAEQRVTADVLGALDDKIAANDRIKQTAFDLARAAFQHELTELPVESITLGELCARGWLDLGDGYRTKRSEHGFPGLRILRAGDVLSDCIILSGRDYVSSDFSGSIGAKASEPGDVVMTTKGTVGRVAVVPEDFEPVVYSPQLCYFRVRNRDDIAPGFLSAWFRSDGVQLQAAARMFKSDMAPYINLRDIQSMTVPMVQGPGKLALCPG